MECPRGTRPQLCTTAWHVTSVILRSKLPRHICGLTQKPSLAGHAVCTCGAVADCMAEAALARQPREQSTLLQNGNIWFGNCVDRQELWNINYFPTSLHQQSHFSLMIFGIINKQKMFLSIINYVHKFLMALTVIIPCFLFPWNLYLKTDCTSLLVLFSIKDQNTIPQNYQGSFHNFFKEVKCKGNTQITNTEETEKHHQVIWLMLAVLQLYHFFFKRRHCKRISCNEKTAGVSSLWGY